MSKVQIPGRPAEKIRDADPDVQRYIRRLERDTMTEPLTGLGNRRAFELYAEELLSLLPSGEHSERKPALRDMGLLMVDVNRFKEANDRLGHPAGDSVLRKAAKAVNAGARRGADRAYRIGGDEFALLLPNADGALPEIAERVRSYFLDTIARERKTVPGLDLAVGFMVVEMYGSPEDVYEAADANMYLVKARMKEKKYRDSQAC